MDQERFKKISELIASAKQDLEKIKSVYGV